MATEVKVWGLNHKGETVKEHDKLKVGDYSNHTWETHVLFDKELNRWHREHDYYYAEIVGFYLP